MVTPTSPARERRAKARSMRAQVPDAVERERRHDVGQVALEIAESDVGRAAFAARQWSVIRRRR